MTNMFDDLAAVQSVIKEDVAQLQASTPDMEAVKAELNERIDAVMQKIKGRVQDNMDLVSQNSQMQLLKN